MSELGSALLDAGDWNWAGQVFANARSAFSLMFGEGLDEAEAQHVIAEAGPAFSEGAFAAVACGEIERGFDLASEGRTQMMAVALRLQSLEAARAERGRLEELRTAIREASLAYDETSGPQRGAVLQKSLRQEMQALVQSAASTVQTAADTTPWCQALLLCRLGKRPSRRWWRIADFSLL